MKLITVIALTSASVSYASPLSSSHITPAVAQAAARIVSSLNRRGAPDAPDGYTPTAVDCPSTRPSIRAASGLSSEEMAFRSSRIPNTLDPMRTLLARLNITGLDTTSYLNTHQNNVSAIPKISIAASGGGYRALMNGAGAISAFDSRTTNATGDGQLGGLLQSSLYLAGLSGGGWLVGSLAQNNFTTVEAILNYDSDLWDFSQSIFEGPDGKFQLFTSTEYYTQLDDQVDGKGDAGFNTTVTDYWGRALAYQLINATQGGPGYTWSSLANGDYVTQATFPLPILIADGRRPGETAISSNTTIFEFNPWEFGSWDPTVYGFAPMRYTGSNFANGELPSNESCIAGYDSASFVMGTSSSLFNQFALQFSSDSGDLPGFVKDIIQDLLNAFSASDEDIASWVNPFYGYNPDTNRGADSRQLTLVDGGENNENLPLHPLIQPVREVDVIFAIDSSADTNYNWPNGSSLVSTYQRSLNASLENSTSFPSIPDTNTFINLGLNTRPTFFGCDGTNISDSSAEASGPPPLIVYLPNSPYIAFSNLSTFDPSYDQSTITNTIINGYNVATRGNASTDNWPTCVGCAILQRSLVRTGTEIPEVCQQCFTTYCWNGTLASQTPPTYAPTPILGNVGAKNAAVGGLRPSWSGLLLGGTASLVLGGLAL